MHNLPQSMTGREPSPQFSDLHPIGRRGYRLKKPLALRAITPAIGEAERQRLLGAGHNCWHCSKPAPVESWLFACRMRGRPVGLLVCPDCLPRVRGWKPGIQIRLFAPMEVTP